MVQPPGYTDPQRPGYLCKLEKLLYVLKQAPRAWFARLSGKLQELGFVPSKADVSLFIYKLDKVTIYMIVYVDDIIVVSSTASASDWLLVQLHQSFPVKDLGRLGYFLAIEVKHQKDGLHLSQQKYISHLLARTNMTDAKTVSTPMATSDKLSRHIGTPLSAEDNTYTLSKRCRWSSVLDVNQTRYLFQCKQGLHVLASSNRHALVNC
jgi:hypothetical protein